MVICFSFSHKQVLEEFYNIFGAELKAVTGDPKRIDDVLNRVDGLIKPMENLTFDPFSITHSHQWKLVMDDFKNEVQVCDFSFVENIISWIKIRLHENTALSRPDADMSPLCTGY